MISVFIQEQKRYDYNELSRLFGCDVKDIDSIIGKLKRLNLIRMNRINSELFSMDNLIDEEIEIEDRSLIRNKYYYTFVFVGVIIICGHVLVCYPKYILSDKKPIKQMRTILKVLARYNAQEQIIPMYSDPDKDSSINSLALMLYLLYDYFENGLYNNVISILEKNGPGDISWDRTISDTTAFMNNNRPYYMEPLTRRRVNNQTDYFRRMHAAIISACSEELLTVNLADIFDIEVAEISNEKLTDFGDTDEILYRIQNEISEQFNTHKRSVLFAMYTYITKNRHLNSEDYFSTFGTSSFNLVWEKACSNVMENKLKNRLSDLNFVSPTTNGSLRLIDLIEKPKWHGENNEFMHEAKDTLIPDIITFEKAENGKYHAIILDAKYYNLILDNNSLARQPGVEDITKQYLYQLAYRHYFNDIGISDIRNCFLVPTEKDRIINMGFANLDFLDKLGLQSILIRALPADKIFIDYLTDKKFDVSKLEL